MSLHRGRPYVIGLTGNIAGGKSTVRRMLEELGAEGIDADALVHQLLAPGRAGHQQVVEVFGRRFLDREGRIDRRALGAWVFHRPEELGRLEAILHPLVAEQVERRIRASQAAVVVVEAVKLVEAGMQRGMDALWLVVAGPEAQAERLRAWRTLSEEEIGGRLAAQPPLEGKLRLATVVIDNSGTLSETREQVERAWLKIPKPEA